MKITLKSTGESASFPMLNGIIEILNSNDSKIITNILIKNKNKLFKNYKDKPGLSRNDQQAIKKLQDKYHQRKRDINVEIWNDLTLIKDIDRNKVFELITGA